MSPEPSIPPLRSLPPGRLLDRKAHLMAQVSSHGASRPAVNLFRPTPRSAIALASIAAAAAASASLAILVSPSAHQSPTEVFHASVVSLQRGQSYSSPSQPGAACQPLLAFRQPPAKFDPEEGTDAQLSRYGFPSRPIVDAPASPAEKAALRHWREEVGVGRKYSTPDPLCGVINLGSAGSSASRLPRSVVLLAKRLAAFNGDNDARSVEWVRTTRQLAVSALSGDHVAEPDRPVYFVVVGGTFEGARWNTGTSSFRATVMSFAVDTSTGVVLDFTLGSAAPNYGRLGQVRKLTLKGEAK